MGCGCSITGGGGCNTDCLSGVDWFDNVANEARLKRLLGSGVGEFPLGDVEKKEDLRCATSEWEVSGVVAGGLTETESRDDFSARALILCEIPEETLIFLAWTTVSVFACGGGQGLEVLRSPSRSGVRLPGRYWADDDLSGMVTWEMVEFLGKYGEIGDLDTEMGLASWTVALCSSSMNESSERYSVSEFSALRWIWMGSTAARRFSFTSIKLLLFGAAKMVESRISVFVEAASGIWPLEGRKTIDSRFDLEERASPWSLCDMKIIDSLFFLRERNSPWGAEGWASELGSESTSTVGTGVSFSGTTVGVLSTDSPSSSWCTSSTVASLF